MSPETLHAVRAVAERSVDEQLLMDAQKIVAALKASRTDVLFLCAEVEALTRERDALRAAGQQLRKALSFPSDTQFAAGAIREWDRLTTEEPT